MRRYVTSAGRPRPSSSAPVDVVLPANSSWTTAKWAGCTLALGQRWSMNGTALSSLGTGRNGSTQRVELARVGGQRDRDAALGEGRHLRRLAEEVDERLRLVESCLLALAPRPGRDAGRDLQRRRRRRSPGTGTCRCRPGSGRVEEAAAATPDTWIAIAGLAGGHHRGLLLERGAVRVGVEVAALLQLQIPLVDRRPSRSWRTLLAGEHVLREVRVVGEDRGRHERVGDQLGDPRRLRAERDRDLARLLELLAGGEELGPRVRRARRCPRPRRPSCCRSRRSASCPASTCRSCRRR